MRLPKRWLPSVIVGVGVLVSSTLVGCRESEKRKTALKAAVDLSGGGGAASPIEDYRDAHYRSAIRGLS